MDEPKKMAKSDAWENIKLCHLVNITLKDSNKLDWIKKGKVCYWEQTLPAVVVVSSKKTSPKAGGPLLRGPNKKGKVCYWEQTLPNGNFSNTQKNNTNKKRNKSKGQGDHSPSDQTKKAKFALRERANFAFPTQEFGRLVKLTRQIIQSKGLSLWISAPRPVLKGEVKPAFALLLYVRFPSSLSWP